MTQEIIYILIFLLLMNTGVGVGSLINAIRKWNEITRGERICGILTMCFTTLITAFVAVAMIMGSV